MTYAVVITEPAEHDIQSAFEWWRDQRSPEQASRWFGEIMSAIETLRNMPLRCPLAAESDLHPNGLRELHFGIGRRPTHRIVFRVHETTVFVVRVRHSAQQGLTAADLVE